MRDVVEGRGVTVVNTILIGVFLAIAIPAAALTKLGSP
jgi:hypothetical protein